MNMFDAYKYFAFISYSHKDEKWGNRIHKSIIRYRVPIAIRRQHGESVPRRVRPLFLDSEDLKVGRVWENIKRELEQSRHLIVICSPNSAKRNEKGEFWVNDEVAYFASLEGGASRIIPVIVDGTPDDAFCPALKALGDLQWQEARKVSKARLVSNIIAGLLGLAPDALWRSEVRRMWRRRSLALSALALLAFLGIDARITHTRYYAEVESRWGRDVGRRELGSGEIADVPGCYRFEYRGYRFTGSGIERKLQSVVSVDSNGVERLAPNVRHNLDEPPFKDYSRRSYKYDEDDRLIAIGEFTPKGWMRAALRYDKGGCERAEVRKYDERGNPMASGGEKLVCEYGKDGKMARVVRFAPNGFYCVATYNSRECLEKIENYMPNGERGIDGNGVSIVEIKYDAEDNEIGQFFYDQYHIPAGNISMGGVVAYTNSYDSAWTYSCRCWLGADGKPKVNAEGYSKVEVWLNAQHLAERKLFYGADGRLKAGDAGKTYKYDGGGRVIEETRLGEDLLPAEDENGCATLRTEYDDVRRLQRKRFYNRCGDPQTNVQGGAGIELEFDDRGREIRMSVLGRDGEYANCALGFASEHRTFDDAGRLTALWRTDREGAQVPVEMPPGEGFDPRVYGRVMKVRMTYDPMSFCRDFDVMPGLPWSTVRMRCFPGGLPYRVEILNQCGALVCATNGLACMQLQYNEYGELKELVYLNEKQQPVDIKPAGVAMMRCEYVHDEMGVSVSVHFLNAQTYHVPLGENGASSCNMRYDRSLRLVSAWMVTSGGKPCKIGPTGIEKVSLTYDSAGRISDCQAMKANGEDCPLCPGTDVSRILFEYDDAGEIVLMRGLNGAGSVKKEIVGAERIRESGFVSKVHDVLMTFVRVYRYRKNFTEMISDDTAEQLKRLQNGGADAHE